MITNTVTQSISQNIPRALDIPYVTAQEAYTLLTNEFERFNQLLDKLSAEDWDKPTACTAWTVKDILAHQAGGFAGGTGYREFIRQASTKKKPGQLIEDAINALQVGERRDKSPSEIIAEISHKAPKAIHNWSHGFKLVKWISIPHPVSGTLSLRYLMWVIHSRDTWMHRLDICRATGKHFEQTAEHDGRIAALVMRDVAHQLAGKLAGKAIEFDLSGVAGGVWKVGDGEEVARIRMDALNFNVFVSGRFSYEEGLARAELSGNSEFLKATLKDLLILF
jgi:uncharacterized protein (TIGR03083 family)